jgi:thiamine biosynthesis protein ThiS
VKITLNGDPFEVAGSPTISELLAQLQVDARRVAVEYNLIVLKRAAFDTTRLSDNDAVEIVNFVGGGETGGSLALAPECADARLQNTETQERGNAGTGECGNAGMRGCRDAGMQGCRDAGMQGRQAGGRQQGKQAPSSQARRRARTTMSPLTPCVKIVGWTLS